MPDYKSMYFKLAGKVAEATEVLIQAQLESEEAYATYLEDEELSDLIDTNINLNRLKLYKPKNKK